MAAVEMDLRIASAFAVYAALPKEKPAEARGNGLSEVSRKREGWKKPLQSSKRNRRIKKGKQLKATEKLQIGDCILPKPYKKARAEGGQLKHTVCGKEDSSAENTVKERASRRVGEEKRQKQRVSEIPVVKTKVASRLELAQPVVQNGCSLRMLNPQAFSVTVWNVLSILQEHFGSMAGANIYLTPPGTQGFAPHYDDIEAFVIQLEGKKHWRVYSPRAKDETLPQFSSCNFNQEEIGKPVLETVLEAGDLLYFPRGFIHQGDCLPDAHSLHITVSSYQKNCWGNLLQEIIPAALQIALEEDVEFRQGLPLDYLDYMGVQNLDKNDPRRSTFTKKACRLMKKLVKYAPIDAAVDQRAKCFLHDCLPPLLTKVEKAQSVHGVPVRWKDNDAENVAVQIEGKTRVRLLRHNIARLCTEEGNLVFYHTVENSRVYHKGEPKYLEIDPEFTDGVEFLIHSYPNYVSVHSLPCETENDKISLALILFEKGLLVTEKPLIPVQP
ncbi:ribosomal oxygenase 1 isoform X2 [Latimeria chalumnae]|uniref:ribosomal oxygenase 1 isoform X2 n=1 Tax=Latimeria chalumnae TaxID=7897 RepID=UPI0003C126AA|nr:PREDICTED: bifunctional lysine-specific demethylase and histidyl-hydroxylase NO66 isoform X3 [Latimeria chalumnae]|eukprot:XP_005989782.1 PREDICTED: bifunctional lysine-specific demethylase and histidyl-hydroxylase NO66 isoform X3 [Latimeria chalumnae]